MVRAVLSLRIKPGRESAFEDAWSRVADVVRQLPANAHQCLLRDLHDNASYVIVSDWLDAEAFHEFETSAEQDALTWAIREHRESGHLTLYEVVSSLAGQARPVQHEQIGS